ncbi:hypothetical protein JCM24511_03076 [Saitozyma sp. JCM 24511]|nr:hypothetical protein JCM24511_03076 [Saitozyma sp. JCM 24511]
MTTVQTPRSAKSQSNTTPASGQHSAVQRKSDPHSPGLTLRLEQGKDVVDPDGALDVSDDRTRGVVHELDADLGDTTTGSSAAEDLYRDRGGEGRREADDREWMDGNLSRARVNRCGG